MQLAHRLVAAAAAALLLTGGLTGCSMLGDDSGAASSADTGASAGRASFDKVTTPVAKGTFDSPAAQGATVDIAVMGLKVKGRLATLTVQYVPHVPGAEPNDINAYGLNGKHGLHASLIDPVNLKRYVVVKDSGGHELQTDEIFTHMTNDQKSSAYYAFAAPPESVQVIDVQLGSWPTFRDVPVKR